MDVVIYHNPECGTSRNTLGLIRNAGIEPHIIDYRKCPPTRLLLEQLIARAGLRPRAAMRQKMALYTELGLDKPDVSDDALLDAMMEHPLLIERPFVISPKGVRLCRPSEAVLDILPGQHGEFRKESGEIVVDAAGRRAATA